MRLNKNMKLARVRVTKVSWIAAVLFILGNLGSAQGTFSHQDHDSAQSHISSRGTIELVSGHDGLDAKEYMGEIFQKLNSQHALQAANTLGARSGKLVVEFVILRDGSVDYMKVIKSTVDQSTSQAQMDAIRSAAPFPPLPKEFKGKSLKLRLHSEFIAQKPPSTAN